MKTALKFVFLLLFSTPFITYSQGDGPNSHLLIPNNLLGLNAKYLYFQQNLSINGDILNTDLDLEAHSFPLTAYYTFGIKGNFVQATFMANPTTIKLDANSSLSLPFRDPSRKRSNEVSGFSDGFIGLKVGMINSKVITLEEYETLKPRFFMASYFRYWYSGSYDKNENLNIGTNRSTFEYGLPMNIPIAKQGNSYTNLELFPSIRFYSKNKEVLLNPLSDQYVEKTQKPQVYLESHFIHTFSKKIWLTFNGIYQIGGETTTNGIDDDNKINMLSASFGAGYQIADFLAFHVDYGGTLFGKNDAESKMLRFNLDFYLPVSSKK